MKETTPNITANGHIKFIDIKKEEYSIDDILDLVKLNFGYSPFLGKTKDKATKEYKRVRRRIVRGLEGKKLSSSTPRKPLYSKIDVYRFLNDTAYKYFLKASNEKDKYERKIKDSKAEFTANMQKLSLLTDDEISVAKKKQEVIMRIVIDYITNNCIEIDEQLIEEDIYFCEQLSGEQFENLSEKETWIYNRLHENVSDYYTIKK